MNRIFALATVLQNLAERIGNAFRWLPPTVARIAVGWIFVESGWGKLHNLQQVTDYFTQLGLPAPAFQATLASTTEFVCGSLILIGLATRFAAVPLIITMIVAIRTALLPDVESLSGFFGLSEFLYICLLLWLGTHGPGPLSADWLIERLGSHRTSPVAPSSARSRALA